MAGQFFFVSAGKLSNATFEDEAKQSIENIKSIIQAAGLCLEDIINTTVFITDISFFDKLNEVYATYFPKNPPSRVVKEVSKLAKSARRD